MEFTLATKDDLIDIKKLYSHYILKTYATWQRVDRPIEYYEKRIDCHDNMHPIIVAKIDGEFIGFGSLSKFRGVCGYDKTCENSIYLKPEYIGKGYGKLVMQKLLDEAINLGYWAVTAWIDSENTASIKFHESYGFYVCGTMNNIGNKGDVRRSVTIMQVDLDN